MTDFSYRGCKTLESNQCYVESSCAGHAGDHEVDGGRDWKKTRESLIAETVKCWPGKLGYVFVSATAFLHSISREVAEATLITIIAYLGYSGDTDLQMYWVLKVATEVIGAMEKKIKFSKISKILSKLSVQFS